MSNCYSSFSSDTGYSYSIPYSYANYLYYFIFFCLLYYRWAYSAGNYDFSYICALVTVDSFDILTLNSFIVDYFSDILSSNSFLSVSLGN